jgi:hypothetical protein
MDVLWLGFRAAELRRSVGRLEEGRRKILFIPYLPLFRTGVPRISIREDAVCLCKHFPSFSQRRLFHGDFDKNGKRYWKDRFKVVTGDSVGRRASRLSVKIDAQSPIDDGRSPAIFTL